MLWKTNWKDPDDVETRRQEILSWSKPHIVEYLSRLRGQEGGQPEGALPKEELVEVVLREEEGLDR